MTLLNGKWGVADGAAEWVAAVPGNGDNSALSLERSPAQPGSHSPPVDPAAPTAGGCPGPPQKRAQQGHDNQNEARYGATATRHACLSRNVSACRRSPCSIACGCARCAKKGKRGLTYANRRDAQPPTYCVGSALDLEPRDRREHAGPLGDARGCSARRAKTPNRNHVPCTACEDVPTVRVWAHQQQVSQEPAALRARISFLEEPILQSFIKTALSSGRATNEG